MFILLIHTQIKAVVVRGMYYHHNKEIIVKCLQTLTYTSCV